MKPEELARLAEALSMRCRRILAGQRGDVQGAVLADLLSLWIAGHHPELRERMLKEHIACVEDLVPESEKEMFGAEGHPGHSYPLNGWVDH